MLLEEKSGLPSLPKHILLYESFGWTAPHFIHLPLLLNPDKTKLSKRQGDVDVDIFLEKGYLKETIINFIALLGWHPNNNNEIFNINQLIKNFSINRIQKSGAIFDIKKLDWMNTQYIKNLSINELIDLSSNFINNDFDLSNNDKLIKVFTFIKDRITTFQDIPDLMSPFYKNILILDKEILNCINEEKSQSIMKYWDKELLGIDEISKNSINKLIEQTSESMEVSGKQILFSIKRGIIW